MSEAVKKKNALYHINGIVCLLIMFGVGQIPATEPLTQHGMHLIGIFLGLLYGWIFVDIVWPSLAGLLALMLVGGMAPKVLLNSSFGDPIVVMMFFIFIFCAAIDHYGLSLFISLWFISRKFVAGKPWLFTFTFLGSIFLLGGLTSASPAAIIGWSILYGICDLCGYKKGDGYPTMMIFGIVFAAQVGMCMIPFKQVPLTVIGAFENISGIQIDYAKYMLIAILCCVACSILFVLIGKFIFRPDVSKLANLDASKLDKGNNLQLTKVQKIVLSFLFALVALLLLPSFLPKDFILTKFLTGIGGTGTCIFVVGVMAAIKVDGKPLLPMKKMIDKGVAWGIIFLLAVVQPLSAAMTVEDSGITAMLMKFLNPIFGGHSPIFFMLVIGLIAAVLTNVMNNGALGVALMPIVFSYCTANQIDPQMSVIMIVLCVHLAFLTPAASSSAALLHGNEWIRSGDIMKSAPIVVAASWIIMSAITLMLGTMIF